ncbi:hypothetical protein PINS_up009246 [Pythium insidiosum]|nr:hypothetical protein PINS_up009246 [Pythium insidiosum]
MEKVLEKISREHDEERRRLELVLEVEKARQKEELRRRKEKRRRERLAKKAKKEQEQLGDREPSDEKETEGSSTDATDSKGTEETSTPLPPPVQALPPIEQRPNLTAIRAESKTEDGNASEPHTLGIRVPGHGRVDLSHLLSEAHAKRLLERRGVVAMPGPSVQALLNPTSLKYLAETLAKKSPDDWMQPSPKSSRRTGDELVIEEAAADEK